MPVMDCCQCVSHCHDRVLLLGRNEQVEPWRYYHIDTEEGCDNEIYLVRSTDVRWRSSQT